MKYAFSFLFVALLSFIGNHAAAQIAEISHDLEIFSPDGYEFTLYVNGKKINETPASNVKLENTSNENCMVKIVFQDTALGTIEKKHLQIGEPGAANSAPVSTVYKVVKKKEEMKLVFASRSQKKIQIGN